MELFSIIIGSIIIIVICILIYACFKQGGESNRRHNEVPRVVRESSISSEASVQPQTRTRQYNYQNSPGKYIYTDVKIYHCILVINISVVLLICTNILCRIGRKKYKFMGDLPRWIRESTG